MDAPMILLLIPLAPLAGAAVLAAARRRWSRPAIAAVACSTVALAFLAALWALWRLRTSGSFDLPLLAWQATPGRSVSLGLLADPLSVWFALVVTGIGFLIHAYSAGYMAEDADFGRYFAELNYFVFAMSWLVLSDGFLGLMIGWANVGLASFLLIGFWNRRPPAAAASMKAFVINVGGEIGLMLGLALIFATFGTLNYAEVFDAVARGAASEGALTAIGLFLLVAAVAKSAQLPLHTWLPDAMQGPTPVSALIHAATMVTAGVYLVARAHPIYLGAPAAMTVVAVIGALSALIGALVATAQNDVKKVLAFSTMSQVGYMFLGAGVGAYAASLFHFFTHAFFKALLFLGAGVVIHALHGEQDIRRMGGLGRRMPAAYWTMAAGALALAGIPPFAGFFSKEAVLEGALARGHTLLWLVGAAGAGLTAFYVTRLFCLVFAGPSRFEGEIHPVGPSMLWPVVLLAIGALVVGWIGIPGVSAVPEQFLGPVFEQAAGVHPGGDAVTAYPGSVEVFAPAGEAGVAGEAAEAAGAGTAAGEGAGGEAVAAESAGHEGGLWNWGSLAVLALTLLGALTAYGLYGPNGQGRKSADEPAAGLRLALEQGLYFDAIYRAVVVRPALALSGWLGSTVETAAIDGAVEAVAAGAGELGKAVSRAHGGYVRRYALTVVAGTAAVVLYLVWVA